MVQRRHVWSNISTDVPLRWLDGKRPTHPIRRWFNHRDLTVQTVTMWDTLRGKLIEGAVIPWDVQARGVSMGLSGIKCVTKTDSKKLRIVIVLCDVNDLLDPKDSRCTL